MKRRALLHGLAAALAGPPWARAAAARVVVVGAGWAGLAAVHGLRQAAPDVELTLIDREPVFRSLPLSSPWLLDLAPERLPRVDLALRATRHGFRFVAADVSAIDRTRRRVHAGDERLDYDALLLAPGAVADPTAWFGDDRRAADALRQHWSAGFAAGELDRVRQGLQAFEGGDLVMTIPPAPYRCPPAPYERAALIANWIRRRGLRARLTVLDASGGMPRFNRLFADRHAAQIDHRLHVQLQSVDPFAQRITSTEGVLRWDHALLLPPMHAGPLVAHAGLLSRDAQGRPGRWAAVDADTLRSTIDDRVWIAGDAQAEVSPLFGAYPKTAHIAADVGAAAARQIVAALRGQAVGPAELPRSQCHVWLGADPPEQLQLEAAFRRRGDGLIVQTLRQADNPQPRDEDGAWARGLLQQRLGVDT